MQSGGLLEVFFIIGLIDSDGSIGWSWSDSENTFIPSVYITQKLNFELLDLIKATIGGYVTKTNGNWVHKTIKGVQTLCLPLLFIDVTQISTCTLITSKRYDALLLHFVMTTLVSNNNGHRTVEGKCILIDLRNFLHFGKSRTGAKTSAELEASLKVASGSSIDCGKQVAEDLNRAYEAHLLAAQSQIMSGIYLNPWQVAGFFVGHGGLCVVWGSKLITTTLSFTGDFRSATALEIYAASLLRDGVYRKAWQSLKNDSSRLMLHGVELVSNVIIPFFNIYPIPKCKKEEILQKIGITSNLLVSLKAKQSIKQEWIEQDWNDLLQVVELTWSLNPSGKNRKFSNPADYIKHLRSVYKNGELNIR